MFIQYVLSLQGASSFLPLEPTLNSGSATSAMAFWSEVVSDFCKRTAGGCRDTNFEPKEGLGQTRV